MSYLINNLDGNKNIRPLISLGAFSVYEYVEDRSVAPEYAAQAYFSSKMNVHKRQVVCDLSKSGVVCQAGAMHWSVGNVNMTSGVKGIGDFLGKSLKGKLTGESTLKPEFTGDGTLVLEPTFRHILLIDMSCWQDGLVVDDGMFLASELSVKNTLAHRQNLSSAAAGGEGLFNMCFEGNGVVCLESFVPQEELIEIKLNNDTLKVDGNFAVAWSKSLDFRVEKSSKTIVGSAMSGEGLVNVYRGTGRVLLAPVR